MRGPNAGWAAVIVAAAAIAGGCGSSEAGTEPTASAPPAASAPSGQHDPVVLARAISAFHVHLVEHALDVERVEAAGLPEHARAYRRELEAIRAPGGAGPRPVDAAALARLDEIARQMDAYLAHAEGGRRADMQVAAWRLLWAHNGLPDRIVRGTR